MITKVTKGRLFLVKKQGSEENFEIEINLWGFTFDREQDVSIVKVDDNPLVIKLDEIVLGEVRI